MFADWNFCFFYCSGSSCLLLEYKWDYCHSCERRIIGRKALFPRKVELKKPYSATQCSHSPTWSTGIKFCSASLIVLVFVFI